MPGGGKVVAPVREVMGGRVAVVQDPAGAVMALWEGPKSPS
jgi:predicted enzyme related to lactoylglutathione lyase